MTAMRRGPALLLLLLAVALGAWLLLSGGGAGPGGALDGSSYLDEPARTAPDPLAGGGDGGSHLARETGSGGVADDGARARAAGAPVTLVGRVVDDRRRPVPGASVEIQWGRLTLSRGETGPDGRYRLTVPALTEAATRVSVTAQRTGYGLALVGAWLAGGFEALEVPPLVLLPAHVLRVRVLDEGTGALGASVAALRRDGGMLTPVARGSTDAEGRVAFDGLAAGVYEVYAARPGRGRTRAVARLPLEEGAETRIELGPERSLDILVVDARTERPVADATVELGDPRTLPAPRGPGYPPASPVLRTDRRGRVTVRGLGAGETLYVSAEARGYAPAPWFRTREQMAPPGQTEVVVRLPGLRTVTFPVTAGAPADGSSLRVDLSSRGLEVGAAITARMDGSYLLVEGLPDTTVPGFVIAPDGAQAQFLAAAGEAYGAALTFVPARVVRVRLVDPARKPLPGLSILLRPLEGGAPIPPAVTDGAGLAVFSGVVGRRIGVHRTTPDQPTLGLRLGEIELEDGERIYEVEVPATLGFEVAVTVDDEPRLPAEYMLLVAGRRVSDGDLVEDPATGTIQVGVSLPPGGGTLEVALHAQGYRPATAAVEATAGGGERIQLALRAGGTLIARVEPPPDARYALRLERRDGTDWVPAQPPTVGPGAPEPTAEDGYHRYAGLEDGAYRVVDARTGFTSAAVDVRAGAAPAEVRVDLGGSLSIEGRVEAPAGTALAQARVLVDGRDDPANVWAGVRPGADGHFQLRALRGERLTAFVMHPTLAAAERAGRVTFTAGDAPLVLRLEQGAEAVFRVEGFEATSSPPGAAWYAPLTVQLHRGDPGRDPVLTTQPIADAGTFRFGGFAPGTYTLWIGFGAKYAPTVRRGLELGAGRTELGLITPSEGETLIFDLQEADAGFTTLWASATSVEPPAYARHGSGATSGQPLALAGVGAGRFRVVVRGGTAGGVRVLMDEERTFDGRGETRITVGVR